MKIPSGNSAFYTQFKKILDRDANHSQSDHPSQEKKEDSSQNDSSHKESEHEYTTDQLLQAIQAFEKDHQAQAYGVKAYLEGQGNALRVVLKDVNGNCIRQLTSHEFVKMRANVLPTGLTCGKILDLKL